MQHLTLEELRQLCPHAGKDELDAIYKGAADLDRHGVNTPLRLAHFLAQICHETAGLTLTREDTNWTGKQMCLLWPGRFKTQLDPRILACRGDPERLAELAYGGREDLGNYDEGDGWAYRGGGMIQITGRAAYREAGNAIGIDLEGSPDLIDDPVISLAAALWYWTSRGCNALADGNHLEAIGNAINRGNPYSKYRPIGAEGREQWFRRAWAIVGEGGQPGQSMSLGARGPAVASIQARLRDLGYPVGAVDGVYGPTMARALAAFRHDNHVQETGDEAGPATQEALRHAKPITVSPERANATAKELAAAGSTEAQAGLQGAATGQVLLYGGVAGGLQQTGTLEGMVAPLRDISLAHKTIVPVIEAIGWGFKNALWVVVIFGGVLMWTRGRQIVSARLAAHREGKNLSR